MNSDMDSPIKNDQRDYNEDSKDSCSDSIVYQHHNDSNLFLFENSLTTYTSDDDEISENHCLFHIFSEDISQNFFSQLKQLNIIWNKMQLSTECQHEKIIELKKEIRKTLNEFVKKEQTFYESCMEEKNSLEKEIETLLGEMIIYKPNSELVEVLEGPNVNINDKQNLQNKVDQLKEIFQTLTEYRNNCIKEIIDLQNELRSLIEKLGLNQEQFDHFLSTKFHLTKVGELQNIISQKKCLLYQRELQCGQMTKMISFLAQIIPLQLKEFFLFKHLDEEGYLCQNFIFSESNVEYLKKDFENIVNKFRNHWESIKIKFDQLEKIYILFDLKHSNVSSFDWIKFILQENKSDEILNLDFFYSNWKFPKDTNLTQIYEDLEKEYYYYEQLKSQRLEMIINNIRKYYIELLGKCLVDTSFLHSDLKFKFLFDNSNYDSELLKVHENELKKLKNYYNKYEEFFTLMFKWNKLEKEIAECDQQSKNSYKLKNRGGIMQQILNKRRLNEKKLLQIKHHIKLWCMEKSSSLNNGDNNDDLPLDLYGLKIEKILSRLINESKSLSKNRGLSPMNKRISNMGSKILRILKKI